MTAPGGSGDEFGRERARLLGLAYRVTGSVVDAEDVVQDAWIRWSAADRASIERPAAWLTTVTTRLALDRLKSASHRRETYVGPWLPEPIVTSPGPEETAEIADTLTFGFLAMLETLDPVSRVVFLLADVFGLSSDEVSEAVGKSAPACRQVASRARKKLRAAKPRRPSAADRQVVDRLLVAITSGDAEAAMALMADDVVLVTDGGPKRHAARRPVLGPFRVQRFLTNIAKRIPPSVAIEPTIVNGAHGMLLRDGSGEQDAAIAFDFTDGLVSAIWVVSNPDKLTRIDKPVSLA
ncbi:MAG TPA: RNA polymerase sigma factor SigJ [Acidimicrobiales bacterium]|nr:RNA polymerase sigma factor SigJ [Acidimicrobiales bacterium]